MATTTLFLGIGAAQWATIAASALGPFVAVTIALKLEPRKAQRTQRTGILRQLLSLRQAPWDAGYQTAINLIPIDFKGHADVISAHKAYMKAAHTNDVSPQEARDAKLLEKQKNLIMAIARVLKYPIDDDFLDLPGYQAQAYTNLIELDLRSKDAWIRIADALERQNAVMLPANPPPQDEPQTIHEEDTAPKGDPA